MLAGAANDADSVLDSVCQSDKIPDLEAFPGELRKFPKYFPDPP
jgi:hypothetical protein